MPKKTLKCFNLYQPWADAVVDGRLSVLIRRFKTNNRGRVGVASTQGIDELMFVLLFEEDLLGMAEKELVFNKAIGTVFIDDCIRVEKKHVFSRLSKMVSSRDLEFYPYHMIPDAETVYFWVLSRQTRFSKPLRFKSKGIVWSKAIEDRHVSKPPLRSTSFWRRFPIRRFVDSNKRLKEEDMKDEGEKNIGKEPRVGREWAW